MGAWILAAWSRLPVIVRALLASFVVEVFGTNLTVLPLFGNLKFHPEIPWALPATLVLLVPFWLYFSGRGLPRATQSARRHATRAKSLPWPVWRAALVAVALAVVTVISLRLALPSILPVAVPVVPKVAAYPVLTSWGIFLALALSAGVVEEFSFRGYLQRPLEEAYGIVPALLITGAMFWLAHADKVTWTHLPFHMLASILFGLIVYFSNSLLPAIIGHAISDAVLLPSYGFAKPTFVYSALTAKPIGNDALQSVWQAFRPSALLDASGTHFTLAVLAWLFAASLVLTAISLVWLARVSQRHRMAQAANSGR